MISFLILSLERALRTKEAHYGPEHVEVANTLGNLATAHAAQGDAQTTRTMLERALRILEVHYGPDHVKVADALNNGVARTPPGGWAKASTLSRARASCCCGDSGPRSSTARCI